jgi:hypothetical protein
MDDLQCVDKCAILQIKDSYKCVTCKAFRFENYCVDECNPKTMVWDKATDVCYCDAA